MQVSGFSIIRDGVRFGYPFVESIRSVLPLVDEFVLAVGRSDDDTLKLARAIDSPKLRILETVWDETLRRDGLVMSQQTNLALDQCQGDWCFYLQGDEVIHEQDYDQIAEAMRRNFPRRRVKGLSFRYHHFYGSYGLINPFAYRRQTRIVRRGVGIRSVGDACGFRIEGRKLRSKPTGASVYHYGWVRNPVSQYKKWKSFVKLYVGDSIQSKTSDGLMSSEQQAVQYETSTCKPFCGTHPAVMRGVIAAQDWPEPEYQYTPWWQNAHWWNAILRKNFRTLHRLTERSTFRSKKASEQKERRKAA